MMQAGDCLMKFCYHTISWNLIRFPNPEIEQIAENIKKCGFQGVEGLNIKDEKDLVSLYLLLKKKGLEIQGISCPDIIKGIEFSSVIGSRFYQTGGWYRNKLITGDIFEDLKLFTDEMEEIGKFAKKLGVKLAVHPHLHQICENREEIDFLMENTKNVYLVIDTAHQTAAGVDPIKLFLDYKDRVAHIHLKDWDKEANETTSLGMGSVDFDKFLETVKKEGYKDWLGVEFDRRIEWSKQGGISKVANEMLKKNAEFLKERGYL